MPSDEKVPIKRKIRCPKCGEAPDTLQEVWRGHVIDFSYDGESVDKEGYTGTGEPFKVVAVCGCGHIWALRGITQITDLYKHRLDK